MRVLLVRHGETVDNVAQVYAGVTDSALTVHGWLQATRLAAHLVATQPPITHLFSSDLSRARHTAEAVLAAQLQRYPQCKDSPSGADTNGCSAVEPLELVQLPLLQEQDFGSLERATFTTRLRLLHGDAGGADGSDRQVDGIPRPGAPGFRDVESKASLAVRANAFLDGYLLPVLWAEREMPPPMAPRSATAPLEPNRAPKQIRPTNPASKPPPAATNGAVWSPHKNSTVPPTETPSVPPPALLQPTHPHRHSEPVVVVVSHGIQLSVIWNCLLRRFSPHGVSLAPEINLHTGRRRPAGDMTHLGAWSNTGYLLASIRSLPPSQRAVACAEQAAGETAAGEDVVEQAVVESDTVMGGGLHEWGLHMHAVNCRDHLKGLKRTGGGVGSSKYDEGQRRIETYFGKRQRTM